jgi:hypothetical protein
VSFSFAFVLCVRALIRCGAQAVFDRALPRCDHRARFSVRCSVALLKDLRGASLGGSSDDSSSPSVPSDDDDDDDEDVDGEDGTAGGGSFRRASSRLGAKRSNSRGWPAATSSGRGAGSGRLLHLEPDASRRNATMAAVTKRVPQEVARRHGLKRGDVVVGIAGPSNELADLNLLHGTTKGESARTSWRYKRWEW